MSDLGKTEALQRECDSWERKYKRVTNEMYDEITKLRQRLKFEREVHKEKLDNEYRIRDKWFGEWQRERERAGELETSLKAQGNKIVVAKELLEEWQNAPFFERKEEWEKWIAPLMPRICAFLLELGE